jgi:hypothetical protein
MAAKLRITSRSAVATRHAGTAARSVAPETIAKALGAAEIVPKENVHGAPISLHALRRELESRVRSMGGRPALARTRPAYLKSIAPNSVAPTGFEPVYW